MLIGGKFRMLININIVAFGRGEMLQTNNDETIYPPNDAKPIIIKMPKVAKGYANNHTNSVSLSLTDYVERYFSSGLKM